MKNFVLKALFFLVSACHIAQAENIFKSDAFSYKTAELHATYIKQGSIGESYSVIPYWVPSLLLNEKMNLGARLGVTQFIDSNNSRITAIESDVHFDYSPQLDFSKITIQPLIGIHSWSAGGTFMGCGANLKVTPLDIPGYAVIGFQLELV